MKLNRVYLSDLHSPIGYHLVDLFRTDHTDPYNPTIIVGSSSLPPSSPITHTFNVIHPLLSLQTTLRLAVGQQWTAIWSSSFLITLPMRRKCSFDVHLLLFSL